MGNAAWGTLLPATPSGGDVTWGNVVVLRGLLVAQRPPTVTESSSNRRDTIKPGQSDNLFSFIRRNVVNKPTKILKKQLRRDTTRFLQCYLHYICCV